MGKTLREETAVRGAVIRGRVRGTCALLVLYAYRADQIMDTKLDSSQEVVVPIIHLVPSCMELIKKVSQSLNMDP